MTRTQCTMAGMSFYRFTPTGVSHEAKGTLGNKRKLGSKAADVWLSGEIIWLFLL